jgi:hypothetical protein
MAKFIGGIVFGLVSIMVWAAFADEAKIPTSVLDQIKMTSKTFVAAGGEDSDGHMHALHVEADGSVKCSW